MGAVHVPWQWYIFCTWGPSFSRRMCMRASMQFLVMVQHSMKNETYNNKMKKSTTQFSTNSMGCGEAMLQILIFA